jgi:hypothetical protein
MNRRDLLKKVGLGIGTLTVTPFTVSLFQSCQRNIDWNPIFFKEDEIDFLTQLSQLIIPNSEDIPGAKQLDLLKFVDLYVAQVFSDKEQNKLNNSLEIFKSEYLTNSKKSNFNDIDLNSLVNLLDYYFVNNKSKYNFFLNSLRKLLINAFKTNQFIGENVLVFRPIPGEQKGCVDLKEATNGRAWTI